MQPRLSAGKGGNGGSAVQITHGVINSNISNFCSPNKFPKANIHRIKPDKFTFLNSNLLVSNILNHRPGSHAPAAAEQPDAYVNQQQEMEKYYDATIENKDRIHRVRNLAKCRSQAAMEDMKRQEEEVRRQIDKIAEMKVDMSEKARDIMSRKEDTVYLGRHIFMQGEKFLKNMKSNNPPDKVNKIEATRMLMKERAKTKGRALRQERNSEDCSQDTSRSVTNIQANQSFNQSVLDISMDASQRRLSGRDKEKIKDHQLATMIKNGSYSSVLQVQKRHAAWQCFTEHWAQGFKKNQDIVITKKKRKANRRSPKQRYVDSSSSCVELQYNDKMSRHNALKRYKETFDKTAASYRIEGHA